MSIGDVFHPKVSKVGCRGSPLVKNYGVVMSSGAVSNSFSRISCAITKSWSKIFAVSSSLTVLCGIDIEHETNSPAFIRNSLYGKEYVPEYS